MASPLPSSSTVTSTDSSTSTTTNPPVQKSYSCVLCAQRKVKCDKCPSGCSNCAKAHVQCIYKAPHPPRRRKKGVREIDINTRLRLYEDALKKLGVDPAELEREELSKLQARKGPTFDSGMGEGEFFERPDKAPNGQARIDAGMLVADEGKSRYLENNLWTSLRGEFRDTKEILDESSEDEAYHEDSNGSTSEVFSSDGGNLLFGSPKSATGLRFLHPQPVQIFKLWQTYLDNVNPLVKVFHTPTVQQLILNASGNLDDVPKNLEALMFAIYCVSLSSLGDVECDAIMGEPKSVVTPRFRSGAQHALVNASFLKSSDLMVLQALVLFLLSLQNFDARVIWILTGVAGRIGQRIGLHRDGEILGLPPFEIEMRRRLWWQILFIEGFAEKLAGTGSNVFIGDTKRPSNLNDSDLFQGMKELPKEHEGATEMMFFLIRCHVGEFLKRATPNSGFDGFWNKLSGSSVTVAAKDRAINELEAVFHNKFLQYCDHSIPWHFICSYLAKAVICVMRFVAHNPDQYGDGAAKMLQEEKDMLFNNSLQVISYQNLAYTTKAMQGFLWDINMHFQWKAFIYLVSELRYRTLAPKADEAWKEVQMVYEFHPNFAKEVSKRALPIAAGNLTLKAWDAYLAARGTPDGGEPYFIQVLRAQRARPKPSNRLSPSPDFSLSQPPSVVSNGSDTNVPLMGLPQTAGPLQSLQWSNDFSISIDVPKTIPDLPPLDPEQMNWPAWENLLVDFEMQEANGGYPGPEYGFSAQ
ncbi:hypothetical protein K469DRAFT_207762 [Zopfia rhizophila CBS 207.26]|uniref:Zn(2)-C6 fungal-type domain-containing protein n=1 Tax=Zopfia rhizophila CBS 207.26 TaxID=1314779 RepID=A0A6A6DYT8_9PEZI|nr:hypothetical protein K469DRAFT_207762 [Zopfia rhizophila CBS 207.26]